MRRRYAFTLLEVLFSIFILFTMGLALLKFDDWIGDRLQIDRQKARTLYRQSPLLFDLRQGQKREDLPLDAVVSFRRLRDDEIFWLKNQRVRVQTGKAHKEILFQNGDIPLTYRLFPIRLGQGEGSVAFVGVVP